MYLRQLELINNGRLERFRLLPNFDNHDLPSPVVLVGENGSGKTNLLSIIADAIFEVSAEAFQDSLPSQGVSGRAFFRVSGGKVLTFHKAGYATFLRFTHQGQDQVFAEKHGTLDEDDLAAFSPEAVAAIHGLGHEAKAVVNNGSTAEEIFENNVFAFFPASRAEHPYWMNKDVLGAASFALYEKYNRRIYQHIYVETAIGDFTQWMLSVLIDSRADVVFSISPTGLTPNIIAPPSTVIAAQSGWSAANQILRRIMDDENARFVWFGRNHPSKIGVQSGDKVRAVGLNSLSNGQLSLLAIFGTLLRYCDSKSSGGVNPFEVPGICIIDEIDAHMHVNLQTGAIPALIKMFPKIQFVISGHSPLFLMGLEQTFSDVHFIELPEGRIVPAEGYREFQAAFETFKASETFSAAITKEVSQQSGPVVWLAGETDPLYFEAACRALGYDHLSSIGLFRWVGSTDHSGQGFFTGDDSLKKAGQMMRANPDIVPRPTLLLFDCDAPQPEVDDGNLHIRTIALNQDNAKVVVGIENLLPDTVFEDKFYDDKIKQRNDGGSSKVSQLNKMKLCTELCAVADPLVFEGFRAEIDRIVSLLGIPLVSDAGETPASVS